MLSFRKTALVENSFGNAPDSFRNCLQPLLTAALPCTLEQFLVAQNLLPRSVKAALAAGDAAA